MSNSSRGQVDSKVSSLISDLSELRTSLSQAKAQQSGLTDDIYEEKNRLNNLEEELEQLKIDLEYALEEESYDYNDDDDNNDDDNDDD